MTDEIRLRVTGTDESGCADIGVYDCGYSNPMKEDYTVTDGAEIIITVDGGEFEVTHE